MVMWMVVLLVWLATGGLTGCQHRQEIPAEIVGDSMAPLLSGRREGHVCDDCLFTFVTSVKNGRGEIACPRCGHWITSPGREIAADQVVVMPGDRPRRWDVVAFEHQGRTMVKRVVGLPGETIDIRNGDVWVDGHLVPKPAAVIRQVKQLVFDSNFRSRQSKNAIDRSLVFDPDRWRRQDNRWIHLPHNGSSVDWISYHHQRYRRNDQIEVAEIQDDSSYNQNATRLLHAVTDLMIEVDVVLKRGSVFHLQRNVGSRRYQLAIEMDRQGDRIQGVVSDGAEQRTFESQTFEDQTFSCPLRDTFRNNDCISIALSNVDQQLTVAIDGHHCFQKVIRWSDSSTAKANMDRRPLIKFGVAEQSQGSIDRVSIWRDVHYFIESGLPKYRLPVLLNPGQYFVLGDNVAVSNDSRHFGPVEKIIGTVNTQPGAPK